MKLLYSFLSLLLVAIKINAQNILPKAYEITTDTVKGPIMLPDSCWQMLEDIDSKFSLQQVSSPPIAARFFKPSPKNTAGNFLIHTYWTRYILKNAMRANVDICIFGYYPRHEIFSKDASGQWHHQLSGFLQPWSKVDGFKTIRAMPVTIPAGEDVLIYERITKDNRFRFPEPLDDGFIFEKDLVNEDDGFISQFYSNAVFRSLIFGVLLFAALLNFVLFMMVRERVYLYFSLFGLSFGLLRFSDILPAFLLKEHPSAAYFIAEVAFLFLFFSLTQFARSYLNTRKYFPAWDKFLVVLIVYTLCILIADMLIGPFLSENSFSILDKVFRLSEGINGVTILITFFLNIRRSEKKVRMVVIAVLPILLFWLTFFANDLYSILLTKVFGMVEPSFLVLNEKWTFQIEQTCVAWFAVVFSWILLLRFIQLRKEVVQQSLEKERLAREKEIEKSQLIARQKIELEKKVEERTAELKHSLENLRSTQTQLIQSEKMASLGELTAGIAHEIQNPLNFVNNFSEVNKEMVSEASEEMDKGNYNEVKNILNDIKDNSEKINHHGKRADAIVKGMLQHSRSSSGQKELTDINALCDEYLRLAYHGLRAKDKTFNAKFETEFDPSIGKINIVPQEIGRVILNLINNAFYAVSERKKQSSDDYEPTVTIKTKSIQPPSGGRGVQIKVIDNGGGIPQNVVDKIFQPFFTTKPTGQGTGLGLSLSYDIIKAHGGEIRVETKKGEGSEFIIQLPIQI
jgi:signal transduction histidine kinase